jgi:hypothetical protein
MHSSLIRPSIVYSGWDADSMQGCVCDSGYGGYDCSERRCPEGRDPLAAGAVRLETFTLQCAAQSGNFNIEVLGILDPACFFQAWFLFIPSVRRLCNARDSSRCRACGAQGRPGEYTGPGERGRDHHLI